MLNFFAIFDSKAEAFMTPFTERTDATAIRAFRTAVADPSSNLFRYSEDYSLHLVGYFDEFTGEIRKCGPTMLMSATAAKRPVALGVDAGGAGGNASEASEPPNPEPLFPVSENNN